MKSAAGLAPGAPYKLIIADNFHYMDESEWYTQGEYPTLGIAIAAGRRIVDQVLEHHYKPGMTAETLYRLYVLFGEDPFIRGPDLDGVPFSAWKHAKARCAEICGGAVR
jgi:hypothetical protein